MSVFLFRLAKNANAPSILQLDLGAHLPRHPRNEETILSGRAEIRIASYGAALDKPAVETQDGFVFCQGYLPRNALPKLSDRLLDEHPITLVDYPESFCAIAYRNGKFGFTSAGTGADQLFVHETPSAVFVTNRHNLLGPFTNDISLRKQSFWWMAGRTHIGDSGTYWNQIQRTLPSRKYVYNGSLIEIGTDYDGLFETIEPADLSEAMTDIVEHFDGILSDISAPKRISLTGGKDSRAILGLLSAVGQTEQLTANTTGYYFSPDVMAATHLTDELKISKQHKITRPKMTQPAVDVAGRVADDLLFDFAGRSLADIGKFSFAGDLVLGGHEAGIKSPLNIRTLDEFVHARRFWVDDRKILKEEVREELTRDYQEKLRSTLTDIPVAYFDKIEGLEYRLPHRNSANITGSHVGGSQLHPFYDGKIVRLICGIPSEFLDQQYIPYYFSALATGDLVHPRFADDAWPAHLTELITAHDLTKNQRHPVARSPFKFRQYFPTEKRFGMSGDRIDLCNMSAQRLTEYIYDNRSFFDYLDLEATSSLINKNGDDKSFREMYVHLGLLKSALVHATSHSLFFFTKRSEVLSVVNDFLSPTNSNSDPSKASATQIEDLEDRLSRYESTISLMERIIVDSEDADPVADARSEPNGKEAKVDVMHPADQNSSQQASLDDVFKAINGEYTIVSSSGVEISQIDDNRPVVLEGRLLGETVTDRSALILFENSDTSPFEGLAYSDKLAGYFRYLKPDALSGQFTVELHPTESEYLPVRLRTTLQKWRGDAPLIIAGTPRVTHASDGFNR